MSWLAVRQRVCCHISLGRKELISGEDGALPRLHLGIQKFSVWWAQCLCPCRLARTPPAGCEAIFTHRGGCARLCFGCLKLLLAPASSQIVMVHGTPKFQMSPLIWNKCARVLGLSLSPKFFMAIPSAQNIH